MTDLSPFARPARTMAGPQPIWFRCDDGIIIQGHIWQGGAAAHVVIINAATGVVARYYERYAAFLAGEGFTVITWDYRGIGRSRPRNLTMCGFRWRDWGTQDFAAVLGRALQIADGRRVMVIGHSIGGVLPGYAPNISGVAALLSVGGQFAYWRDYAPDKRVPFVLKWHVAMPALTALFGYFPGRRLGWLEDLPAGVAFEWAFRRSDIARSFPQTERQDMVERFAAYAGPMLAVAATDDPFATPRATERALSYYLQAQKRVCYIRPDTLGVAEIGHFALFHARMASFWAATVPWLRSGGQTWPYEASRSA